MSFKEGEITRLIVKPEQEGKYGLTAPYSIVVANEYFNAWASEDRVTHTCIPKASKASNYAKLEEGMVVEFMYETNDKGYHQIDSKTLKVKNMENTNIQNNTVQSTQTSTDNAYIKAQCMKMAIDILKYQNSELNMDIAAKIADKIYKYCMS